MNTALASGVASASRLRIGPWEFLRVYLVLLFALPANLTIAGTGAIGSPATLLGVVAFGWWIAATLLGHRDFAERNVVRIALFCYLGTLLFSWTLGRMRVLTASEASSSDRILIMTVAYAGIALITMDLITSRADIERLVLWITRCAMVMVIVGVIQFFFSINIASIVQIPGLQANTDFELNSRSIFNRPNGTALHAIEFGVVSAALIPLTYWLRRVRRSNFDYVVLAGLAFAVMISLSRSAVLASIVGGLVLLIGLPSWSQRISLVLVASAFVVAAGSVVGGLVGTLRSLFAQTDTDPSVQARIDRIPRVLQWISEYPYLGRGYGTYTPEDYTVLDNQIWTTAIETGLIGVALLVIFIGTPVVLAWRSRVGSETDRFLAIALIATILSIFVSSYTFDTFFYRILTSLLYISIGIVGALYRLTADERASRETHGALDSTGHCSNCATEAMTSTRTSIGDLDVPRSIALIGAAPAPIAVGLPVYNGQRFIADAIKSLLSQHDVDFELLIADNCSTDATEEICRGFARNDSRVRFIRRESNVGLTHNHNRLVMEAQSPLFMWAGADDCHEPTRLRRLVDALDANLSAVLAFSASREVDANGNDLGPWHNHCQVSHVDPVRRFRDLVGTELRQFRHEPFHYFYGAYRRDVLLRTPLMADSKSGDRPLIYQLSLHGPFAEVDEELLIHRIHDRQFSRIPARQWHEIEHPGAGPFVLPDVKDALLTARAVVRSPLSPRDKARAMIALRPWFAGNLKPIARNIGRLAVDVTRRACTRLNTQPAGRHDP